MARGLPRRLETPHGPCASEEADAIRFGILRIARGKSLAYLLCAIVVALLGLASRRFGDSLPAFLAEYAGDTLWALLVFLGVSALRPDARLWIRGAMALGVAFLVELSQLYHAPWIDGIRATTIGGLVLGFGFLWSDLVCYAVGVTIGMSLDRAVRRD
ncbi:MAG: DUF2809 domain-containing protein [Candidatus Hydrogenedentes bacterium]|nr:DUF2809 domain-containing protein [Candidatus Hydrogenedentota bacterium]